jgi:hypothetical protein
MKRERTEILLNILILILACIGTVLMYTNHDPGASLMAEGFKNLKYFTVLSNIFCGIIAAVRLVMTVLHKKMNVLLKLMAASAVGLTFLIIAAFLQPLYPDMNLYERGNLYFHLLVPLFAMAEFVIIKTDEKIPFKYAVYSSALALVYGTAYLVNVLINGIGEWPDTNDWYGFLNWGYPIGILIFAMVVLMDFGIAALLRFLNNCVNKKNRSVEEA